MLERTAASVCAVCAFVPRSAAAPKLRLQEIGADSTGFDVVSTLVIGPKSVIVWDAQYHLADAQRVADAVKATGKHLQAIILSHPDEDHYTGAAAIVQRFPGTPVYMTPAGIKFWEGFAPKRFKQEKPGTVPDSLITPQPLPSNTITLDGEKLELIPDLTGDNPGTNSVLWIPSLRTALAGDIVFNGVHAWLGASDSAKMVAWRESLDRIAALHPVAVVAGHKQNVNAPDSPDQLNIMKDYLITFDALRQKSTTAPELRDALFAKYPNYAVRGLANYSAMTAMNKKKN